MGWIPDLLCLEAVGLLWGQIVCQTPSEGPGVDVGLLQQTALVGFMH